MKANLGIIVLVVLTSLGCSTAGNPANGNAGQQAGKYRLPSGREIKVTGICPMQFADGETALVLNYQTEISIENHEELKKEVEEIWTIFRADVERANTTTGVIRATHIESSGLFVQNGKGYGFLYEKNPDGTWHLNEDKK